MLACLVALAASGCASVELSPDAESKYMQTWSVEASIDETIDSIVAAMNQQTNIASRPMGSFGGAAQRIADRQDRPEWHVIESVPATGSVWLKYRRKGGWPHDVVVKVHSLSNQRSTVRASSRSRMRFFNYRQNRRILSAFTATLEAYWSHHGLDAQPAMGDWQPADNDEP